MHSQQLPPPFRLQLAIQGGGAKIVLLLAAMEVVQKLEADKKIKVTRIAGTSAGAIVGSLFAAGIPMSLVRQRFRDLNPKQLAAAFPRLGLNYVTVKQLGRGKPVWKPDFVKNELAQFLEKDKGVYTFEELAQQNATEMLVVAADLSESGKVVYGETRTKKVIEALLDSCGLPFCFRTWSQSGSAVVVDGGICENLPSDELEKYVSTDGPIVGISFATVRGRSPSSLTNFSIALLETAMNNSMSRARFRLGPERVFSIKTDIGTFDFAKALTEGLGAQYDLITLQAERFFEKFLAAEHNEGVTISRSAWQDQSLLMMSTLGEVYKKQHEPNKLHYLHCSLVIKANSLGDPNEEDEVTYVMKFETLDEPVYCHAVSLSETEHQALFDKSELSVWDEKGNAIEIRKVPIRNTELTLGTGLLLFLIPPLRPNSGTYTLKIKDVARDVLKPLREGRDDELAFTPLRAAAFVDQIDLVVHWPKAGGHVKMQAKKDVEFIGQPMSAQELKKYETDYGFGSVGWTGHKVPSSKEFGVDLALTRN